MAWAAFMTKRYALSGAGLIQHKACDANRPAILFAAAKDGSIETGVARNAAVDAAYYEYGYGLYDAGHAAPGPRRRHTCMFMMS
jgi:hypothetical protein